MIWAIALITFVLILWYSRFKFTRDDVPVIPGPPSKSWLYGNMLELLTHVPYGEIEENWQQTYGKVHRIKGCLGENRLMILDTTALRYMAANSTLFKRPASIHISATLASGKGSLLASVGDDHRRLRDVMNLAFSAPNIRALAPTFSKVAGDLVDRLHSLCERQESPCAVDMYRQLNDTSLQVVGEGIMGYNYSDDDEFRKCYRGLVIATAKRTKSAILVDALLPYLPSPILTMFSYFPPEDMKQMFRQRALAENISDTMVKQKLEVQRLGQTAENDLYSALVNINSKAAAYMTFEELKQQFAALNAAGEDSTGNTLSWLVYELAKNAEFQETLRKEVNEAQQSGHIDYDKLPFLNSFMKEVLRYYSTAAMITREAAVDTVLPLSAPISTTKGAIITEINIRKGQFIYIPIHTYHRLPELYGDDANVFRPSRWTDGKSQLGDSRAIGPFANMLTFWGGAYMCIGWRFALLEMQIVLCELVKTFSFSTDINLPPIYPTLAFTNSPSDGKGNFGMKLRVFPL